MPTSLDQCCNLTQEGTKSRMPLAYTYAWVTPVVYAQGGDATLIHACVSKSNGSVRIVDATASCKSTETELTWPGTSTTPDQGSIMVHSGALSEDNAPQSVCLPPGGASNPCAYRSPRDGTVQNMRLLIAFNPLTGPVVVTILVNENPTVLSTTIPA